MQPQQQDLDVNVLGKEEKVGETREPWRRMRCSLQLRLKAPASAIHKHALSPPQSFSNVVSDAQGVGRKSSLAVP